MTMEEFEDNMKELRTKWGLTEESIEEVRDDIVIPPMRMDIDREYLETINWSKLDDGNLWLTRFKKLADRSE